MNKNEFEILKNDIVKIKLTRGQFGYCDLEDWEKFKHIKWWADPGKSKTTFYINGEIKIKGKKKHTRLHSLLFEVPKGFVINHKDHDGLNCCRSNLEICTYQQNASYCLKRQNNKSGFKGVSWRKDIEMWRSRITVNFKAITIGHFENKIDAAKAYNEAAKKFFGIYSVLNKIPE